MTPQTHNNLFWQSVLFVALALPQELGEMLSLWIPQSLVPFYDNGQSKILYWVGARWYYIPVTCIFVYCLELLCGVD